MRFTPGSTLALVALVTCVSADDVWTTVFEDVVVTDVFTKTVWVSELPASTSQATSAVSAPQLDETLSAYTFPASSTTSTSTSSVYTFQPSTFATVVSSSVVSSTTVAPVASSTTSTTVAPVASSTTSTTAAPIISSTSTTVSSAVPSSTVVPIASPTSAAPAAYSSSSSSSSGTTISVTPHDEYSSSIGVLGCKINTNRVAYWPMAPGCDNLCVKVSYEGRSLNLLHVDQSGGAYDISYDAWNFLNVGEGAAQDPQMGGGIEMTYENVPMSECADLLQNSDGKLAFSAANSMNTIASCISEPSSWVAQNYGLWNIDTSTCTLGYDEECSLDLATSNQPTCPHQLGVQTPLTTCPVYNLAYGTGDSVLAQ